MPIILCFFYLLFLYRTVDDICSSSGFLRDSLSKCDCSGCIISPPSLTVWPKNFNDLCGHVYEWNNAGHAKLPLIFLSRCKICSGWPIYPQQPLIARSNEIISIVKFKRAHTFSIMQISRMEFPEQTMRCARDKDLSPFLCLCVCMSLFTFCSCSRTAHWINQKISLSLSQQRRLTQKTTQAGANLHFRSPYVVIGLPLTRLLPRPPLRTHTPAL